MKAVLFVLSAMLSFNAQAGLREGTYANGTGCTVKVEEGRENGWYIIEYGSEDPAAPAPGFGWMILDISTNISVEGPGLCTDDETVGNKKPKVVTTDSGGLLTYTITCGGAWSPIDEHLEFSITTKGQIARLKALSKISRWSLPGGPHSGPVKRVEEDFTCENLKRVD